MKKLFHFLYILTFLFWPMVLVNAQALSNPSTDPEKIYLFDVKVTVDKQGEIQVTENITLNAQHNQIRRGISRDLPNSRKEYARPISLMMDGEKHPFFTGKEGKILRVNFGNDNYISRGKHTYSLTYKYIGAINFFKEYDELYWNVTGNDWIFSIDKAKIQVSFPPNTHIRKEGISLYTGRSGEKGHKARVVGDQMFETTSPLAPKEGFTISIPFNKGSIVPPKNPSQPQGMLFRLLTVLPKWLVIGAIILSSISFIYFIATWLKVGVDPSYLPVAQYAPPPNISPAFMRYLYTYKKVVSSRLLACALIHLAMEGFIEIKRENSEKVLLTLLRKDTNGLSTEEKIIIEQLFHDDTVHILTRYSSSSVFAAITSQINQTFRPRGEEFITENISYTHVASFLLFLLGVLPSLCAALNAVLFIRFDYLLPLKSFIPIDEYDVATAILTCVGAGALFLINMILLGSMKNNRDKSGWSMVGLFLAFSPFVCLFSFMQSTVIGVICQGIFLVTIIGFAVYVRIIRNVTVAGKELLAYIYGFKHYLKVADINRIAASNPIQTEKIFCEFLPFAFALDLENTWMQKFESVLSVARMQELTRRAGDKSFITTGLTKSIQRAASSPNSRSNSSRSSGSYGGGSSGGGHGGGGGRGR